MKRSPEIRYAVIEDDVASLLQESIYIPCTLELCVPLWRYDAMLAQCGYNGLRRHIGSCKIMHATMTSIQSMKCMTKHKEKHIQHTGIIGFLINLGQTWPILTIAHKTVKWKKQHGFQTCEMLSSWIKHDTMASMNTKYSMATYMTVTMTCRHS